MNEMMNTNSVTWNVPPLVTDNDYNQAVSDFLGYKVEAQLMADTMKASLLSDAEILSWFFLRSLTAFIRVSNPVRNIEDIHLVFRFASEFQAKLRTEMALQIESHIATYKHSIPPRFTSTSFTEVQLREGGTYTLSSDARNFGDVEVVINGVESVLLPGQTLEVSGSVSVASQQPQLIEWKRVGGQVRSGTMAGVIPTPKKVKPLPVVEEVAEESVEVQEEVAPTVVATKRSWFSFKRK